MSEKLQLKTVLYQKCVHLIDQRINTISTGLDSIEESRNNETKSSVGDKHETGRAMMQLEEEKIRVQLAEAISVKNALQKIDPDNNSDQVSAGSLVITNSGSYFIAVGIGKVYLEDKFIYCISPSSPIGMRLMNKQKGESIEFNQRKTEILEIH